MPHRRNIDTDLLRSFVTIIEVKSFTRAAERLLRTQSAISLQMKRLEDQLGCRLFERGGRGVEPTEAGVLLLGYARRILAANDELVGRMAEPSVEGEVRIGATESFATDHLVPILARFTRAFPKVQLKVRTGPSDQLEPALTTGSIDLRIATSVEADASPPEGDLLTRDTLVWCAAEGQDPAMGRNDRSEPVPLVATSAGCVLRQVSETALSSAGIPWALVFEGGSQAAVQSAVGAGLGIAVLPKTSLVAGLHKIAPADALPPLPAAATYLAMRPGAAPVAQRLRAFMLEVYTGKA